MSPESASTSTMELPLAPLRVIDASSGIAGGFCSKLLAQYGATVVKVEPPWGDPLRSAGPFLDDEPGPERSLLFNWLHSGKQSVALDLESTGGVRSLRRLLAGADVLLDSAAPGGMRSRGLDQASLEASLPRLVCTSITPFGQDGPYAGYEATFGVLQALGGWVHAMGERERPPVITGSALGLFMTGVYGAVGTMAALEAVDEVGGQAVEVAAQEAITAAAMFDTVRFQYTGVERERAGRSSCRSSRWWGSSRRATAGAACTCCCRGTWADSSKRWAGQSCGTIRGSARPRRVKRTPRRWTRWWAGGHDVKMPSPSTTHRRGGGCRSISCPRRRRCTHRRSWKRATTGTRCRLGSAPCACRGLPFRLAGSLEAGGGWRRAPSLGEHTRAVLAAAGSRRRRARSRQRCAMAERMRVLDLSQGWAGPMAAYMLSLFGAEVIKIEAARYYDWWRGSPHPDAQPGDQRHESAPNHNSINRNKRGITIDLQIPEGQSLFHELLAMSDVLVENYPPRVVRKLGLEPAGLTARHPRLVLLSLSAFGTAVRRRTTWPLARRWSRWPASRPRTATPTGRRCSRPMPTATLPRGALGAFAVLTAIRERRRTGQGRHIALSELEAAIPHGADRLLEYAATGRNPRRYGNRHPSMAPHGVYPCRSANGSDRFVVIACRG